MKKLFYTFILFFPITLTAQVLDFNKAAEINAGDIKGLGQFKLNVTTKKYLDTLSKILRKPIAICNDDNLFSKLKKTNILKLEADENTVVLIKGSFSTDIDVYYIDNFKLINKYDLKGLYLTFYNNYLVEIFVEQNDPRLHSDLETKYGQPETSDMSEERSCYVNGEDFKLKDTKFLLKWVDKPNEISILFGHEHNTLTCEVEYLDILEVRNSEKDAVVSRINDAGEELYKKNKAAAEKKSLEPL